MKHYQDISIPGPTVTPISQPFWDSVEEGTLSLQQCDHCHEFVFYPRAHCPHCFGQSLTWKETSGQGTLKTWSVIHRPGNPAWQEIAPYAVGVVKLQEGPSMLTHLLMDESELSHGMNVQWEPVLAGETRLPFFKPKQEEQQ